MATNASVDPRTAKGHQGRVQSVRIQQAIVPPAEVAIHLRHRELPDKPLNQSVQNYLRIGVIVGSPTGEILQKSQQPGVAKSVESLKIKITTNTTECRKPGAVELDPAHTAAFVALFL
jgi:hypothetical protein